MRLLGIDFGFKRIGLAVGETEIGIVTPRPAITASGTLKTDAQTIAALAKKEEIDQVVLGLPLDGSEEGGKMARICRMLAGHLTDCGLNVQLVDESFTSVEAEAELRQTDLTAAQRRKQRDGLAACQILERFLDGASTTA